MSTGQLPAALERRGLVTVRGKSRTWTAAITDAGRKWHSAQPAGLLPDESDADHLIARVQAAGGRLVLEKDHDIVASHERLVAMSLKSPARPRGKKLTIVSTGQWGSGPKAVVFTEHFDDLIDPRPVPIPEHIAKYHPAVKAYVAEKDWHFVSEDHVLRAARILQAIATEAGVRGIDATTAAAAGQDADVRGRRFLSNPHLVLQTSAGPYRLQIKEISASGAPRVDPGAWRERKRLPAWIRHRDWEFIGTGKLELVVEGRGSSRNGDHYRDAKTITVEDKLPEVFRAFEIHKLRADWQEQQRQREETQRQHRWEAAMEVARERYFEQARWEHFKGCSGEWQAVNRHRRFLAAARISAEEYDGGDRDIIVQRLDDAERHLDRLDPILQLSRIASSIPDPKAEDLKPFLQGWSPHGPNGLRW
ncbi:hypothetical protein [Nocardia sp. BMG111209]|uniref:hypothetical protein n=1 Tax=Nocardia sp. BMG111209 TaxID=1160137 RepID=UPI0012DC41B3|nr:hypothetical protein [Nocardia sp. BMG111209]